MVELLKTIMQLVIAVPEAKKTKKTKKTDKKDLNICTNISTVTIIQSTNHTPYFNMLCSVG